MRRAAVADADAAPNGKRANRCVACDYLLSLFDLCRFRIYSLRVVRWNADVSSGIYVLKTIENVCSV